MDNNKPNRFMLIAAGFSVPFMEFKEYALSTQFLTDLITKRNLFDNFIKEIYGDPPVAVENLFNVTLKIYNQLIEDYENKLLSRVPNFEHIIYLLETLCNHTDKDSYTIDYSKDRMVSFLLSAKPDLIRKDLTSVVLKTNEDFDTDLTFDEVFFLKEFILDVVALFKIKKDKKSVLINYFGKMLKDNNLKIYNLNYDSLLIEVLEELNNEYDENIYRQIQTGTQIGIDGEITTAAIFNNLINKNKPHALFFLHGSIYQSSIGDKVHVDYENERHNNIYGVKNMHRFNDKGNIQNFSDIGKLNFNQNFIIGLDKDQQLSLEPYSTIFNKCRIDYHSANIVDILGYSFGDQHINSILKNLTPGHKEFNVVDYSKLSNTEEIFNRTQKFRQNFLKMVSKSFNSQIIILYDPDDHLRRNLNEDSIELIDNNIWNYVISPATRIGSDTPTKVQFNFNGIENHINQFLKTN